MTHQDNAKRIIALIVLLVPLVGVGIDIYTPSFPAIHQYFSTTSALVRNTLATYVAGAGIGQLILGPWSDAIGRRKGLLIGLLFYIVSSLCIARSPNIHAFI